MYDNKFFSSQASGSRRSAEAMLPKIMALTGAKSVVDVGCGVGTWLSVVADMTDDFLGIDGDYVDLSQLQIPETSFRAADLRHPVSVDRKFDLAISLEVGEHLPDASADRLVGLLTELSDVVLFSAAIPYQHGTNHINEQYPPYWARKFADHGYVFVDCLRREYWQDSRVAFWYAQNAILYVKSSALTNYPMLLSRVEDTKISPDILFHPLFFKAIERRCLVPYISPVAIRVRRLIPDSLVRRIARSSS